MSRLYPALDLVWSTRPAEERIDVLLAEIDADEPLGVEEIATGVRVFFPTAAARGRAAVRLIAVAPDLLCTPREISDEDWAARSQASIRAVQVGRIVVAPPWDNSGSRFSETTPEVVRVVILPSMGFGTGHHASTRLCLRLLQDAPLAGASVLDVGTGSGVLAIAAAKLGATRVLAIDNDADALASARENVELNQAGSVVELAAADAGAGFGQPDGFSTVLANLTGVVLVRVAHQLASALGPSGQLIASGFMTDEVRDVVRTFEGVGLHEAARVEEDHWIAMRLIPYFTRAFSSSNQFSTT